MQRPVLEALKKKLPVCTSGVLVQLCDAPPLQALRTIPVPLVPAPASRHRVGEALGEMVQLLPFAFMAKTEVESPADLLHCCTGEVPVSMTIAPTVLLGEN